MKFFCGTIGCVSVLLIVVSINTAPSAKYSAFYHIRRYLKLQSPRKQAIINCHDMTHNRTLVYPRTAYSNRRNSAKSLIVIPSQLPQVKTNPSIHSTYKSIPNQLTHVSLLHKNQLLNQRQIMGLSIAQDTSHLGNLLLLVVVFVQISSIIIALRLLLLD